MVDILTLAAARKYTDTTAEEIQQEITDLSPLKFKGVKEYISELPTTGNEVGDVWHVNEDGNEYVWVQNGLVADWEIFGGSQPLEEKAKFVDTLPSSDIDTEAAYYTLASKLFPQIPAEILNDTTYTQVVVTYQDTPSDNYPQYKWRLLHVAGADMYGGGGGTRNRNYKIYNLNSTETAWDIDNPLYTGTSDKNWANNMGLIQTSGETLQNMLLRVVWYAENNIVSEMSVYTYYNKNNNRATYGGTATDVSNLNPYIWSKNKYIDNNWSEINRFDFEELFKKTTPLESFIKKIDLSSNTQNNPKPLNNSFNNGFYVVAKGGYICASNWSSGNGKREQLSVSDIIIKGGSYTLFTNGGSLYCVDNAGTEVTNWANNGYLCTVNDVEALISDNVDDAMSSSSTNPVQNKIIKAYVDNAINTEINAALADIIGGA